MITIGADFRPHLGTDANEAAISEIQGRMKQADSAVKRVFVEAQFWRAQHAAACWS